MPELVRRGIMPDVLTDQTSAHDTLNGYVPASTRSPSEDLDDPAPRPAGRIRYAGPSSRSALHVQALLELQRRGAITFDYGNNLRAAGRRGRRRRRFRHSRLRAGVHPPAVLRGTGAVSLGRPVRRSGGHLSHRPGRPGDVSRTTKRWLAGSGWREKRSSSRDCRPGSAGWAMASGPGWACVSTRWCARGELKAPDRHRPRPSRRRLGGLAEPRDRRR